MFYNFYDGKPSNNQARGSADGGKGITLEKLDVCSSSGFRRKFKNVYFDEMKFALYLLRLIARISFQVTKEGNTIVSKCDLY
jgi:hypothetical protein